jgi:UDP-N-acetylglucosamine 4,6-dehydratase
MYSLAEAHAVLVTGGTGSFGRALVRTLLARYPGIPRIIVFSRDELKQYELAQEVNGPQMRYFIGDVRDRERLARAMEGVDVVVHAAALKQVPAAEYNPFEAVKTNILGAQNVIECALDQGVKRVVALSTDKACAPINLYGATKLCSDKLFVAANAIKGARDLRFGVVRYGNVMGSRGSVIPFFLQARSKGPLPITHPEMTRFNITLDAGVELVIRTLETMWWGEIIVPRIPSYRIMDVAEAIAPGASRSMVGIRPGEKLHEEMISPTDAHSTLELDDHFVMLPSMPLWSPEEFMTQTGARRCRPGFHYESGGNPDFLTVPEIRDLIRRHVAPTFEPRS